MQFLFYTCVLALLCGSWVAEAKQKSPQTVKREEYVRRLADSKYSTDILPEGNDGLGSPVEVFCTMYLIDVNKVDDLAMDYEAQFYFRQSWNDSRLAFDSQDFKEIVLNDADKIWTPDLFMVQEKGGFKSQIIAPNAFIKILPSGEVLYSVRLTLKFTCPMDFRKYPHDTQKCKFNVESYSKTRDKLQLEWDHRKIDPVSANEAINLMNFEFKGIQEGAKDESFQSGLRVYRVLHLTLTFQRKFGFYFSTLYMPFIILVVLSWLSFWIPPKMIAPRLTLLMVLLYLMVNIRSDVNGFIPPSSYTKGSDIWIAVCESLVFACFLEFIAVYTIARNQEKLQRQLCKDDPEAKMQILESDIKGKKKIAETSNSYIVVNLLRRNILVSTRVDKLSRIMFPVLFFIFNFIYWIVYCTGY